MNMSKKVCLLLGILVVCVLDWILFLGSSSVRDLKSTAFQTSSQIDLDVKHVSQRQPHELSASVVFLPEHATLHYKTWKKSKKSVKILFWNAIYSQVNHWNWWFNDEILSDFCPGLPCHFSIDKKDLNISDAIFFNTYGDEALNLKADVSSQLPPFRWPHQRWVFFMIEPPNINKVDHTKLNGLVNWTATYKLDSDIVTHFGRLILSRSNSNKSKMANFAENKTKKVLWMVSHCQTEGRREQFVDELRRFIQVDVYGRCGNLSCSRGTDCYAILSRQYKFYLSFENILCRDYVSEKFSRALASGMVPVVFGGADYSRFAPVGSYINALDFDSPEKLAEHLMFLDANDDAYNRYFDWRRGFDDPLYYKHQLWVCETCMKLLDPDQPPKVYENFDWWWNEDSNCTSYRQPQ